jgi:hypothetical protein
VFRVAALQLVLAYHQPIRVRFVEDEVTLIAVRWLSSRAERAQRHLSI